MRFVDGDGEGRGKHEEEREEEREREKETVMGKDGARKWSSIAEGKPRGASGATWILISACKSSHVQENAIRDAQHVANGSEHADTIAVGSMLQREQKKILHRSLTSISASSSKAS